MINVLLPPIAAYFAYDKFIFQRVSPDPVRSDMKSYLDITNNAMVVTNG